MLGEQLSVLLWQLVHAVRRPRQCHGHLQRQRVVRFRVQRQLPSLRSAVRPQQRGQLLRELLHTVYGPRQRYGDLQREWDVRLRMQRKPSPLRRRVRARYVDHPVRSCVPSLSADLERNPAVRRRFVQHPV